MSLRVSMSRPLNWACSGLMYSGVPIICAKPVKSVLSVSCCPSALATPKSITLTTGTPSCSVTMTFEGFKSRWMMPLWCGVLHGMADVREQRQPLSGGQAVLIAVVGDRHALTSSMTK